MKGNPAASWSSGHSISGDGTGWYTDDDGYWFAASAGRAFLRNGNSNDGALAGCFALNLNGAPSDVSPALGFRCCK